LKKIKNVEKKFFIFWEEKEIVNEKTLSLVRFGKINNYIELNTRPLALETTNKYLWALSEASIPFGLFQAHKYVKNNCPEYMALVYSYIAAYLVVTSFSKYYIESILIKNEIAICNHLQDILISTASHINALKNISLAINNHK